MKVIYTECCILILFHFGYHLEIISFIQVVMNLESVTNKPQCRSNLCQQKNCTLAIVAHFISCELETLVPAALEGVWFHKQIENT